MRLEGNLLRLDISLEGLELAELPALLASYRSRKKYHRLWDGSFLRLEESTLAGLAELAEGLDLSDKQLRRGSSRCPRAGPSTWTGCARETKPCV